MVSLSPGSERRVDARTMLKRPIKVRCGTTGRSFGGQTVNLSASGALLEIDHPVRLVAGQPIRVGIAWTRRDVVLEAANLMEARVVRNLGIGGVQKVAVEFAQRQELAATG